MNDSSTRRNSAKSWMSQLPVFTKKNSKYQNQGHNILETTAKFTHYHLYFDTARKYPDGPSQNCLLNDANNATEAFINREIRMCVNQEFFPRALSRNQITWQSKSKPKTRQAVGDTNISNTSALPASSSSSSSSSKQGASSEELGKFAITRAPSLLHFSSPLLSTPSLHSPPALRRRRGRATGDSQIPRFRHHGRARAPLLA